MSFARDLALDATGDLLLKGGDLAFVDDLAAIAQNVSSRLQFWQGEWFLDRRLGLPYVQQIFAKGASQQLIKAVLIRAIATAPGITQVISLDLTFTGSTRNLAVTWQARSVLGPISQTDNLIFPVAA